MADREKVIKGLREMSCRATWKDIDGIRDKFQPIINGAIDLLKEQPEIVRCKDCRFAHMTYDGLCKQCDNATDDDDIKLTLYLPGDFYCAFGKRKEGDGE